MYDCPECASSIDPTRLTTGRGTCPDCGAPLRKDAQRPWTDVARVNNLAEAGFLTD
jgi:ribosomal protein L37AE/L43A